LHNLKWASFRNANLPAVVGRPIKIRGAEQVRPSLTESIRD
jgi:hypothetical protein